MHAVTQPEAVSDPTFLSVPKQADMFSFLLQSTELQKQVVQFIYRGRIKVSGLHDTLHFNYRQI